MKAKLTLLCILALAACSDRPEGDPVVRTSLDGSEPVSVTAQDANSTPKSAVGSSCVPVQFEGVPLTHCIADPEKHAMETALAPVSGELAGTIAGFAAGRDESEIAFVTNAGMYGDDLKPIGYFVRGSDRIAELNRADGPGNFHMKPNGVLFGTGNKWRVLDSETFYRTVGDRPEFGTQSGPMLVINGKLHPEFQDNGPSRAIRNGVGVDEQGRAHFVISDAPMSFGQLARYFRDELKTPNALFLDGNVSALWDPSTGRMDRGRVGPLLVVSKKQ
jgi:uncharacterized protein YigE (DUF2233 family)